MEMRIVRTTKGVHTHYARNGATVTLCLKPIVELPASAPKVGVSCSNCLKAK